MAGSGTSQALLVLENVSLDYTPAEKVYFNRILKAFEIFTDNLVEEGVRAPHTLKTSG